MHWLAKARAAVIPNATDRRAVLLDVACSGGLLAPWIAMSTAILNCSTDGTLGCCSPRWFGDGPGWLIHQDHHYPRGAWQPNDAIPLVFAGASLATFFAAVSTPAAAWLFLVAAGVTAYGAAYALVRDVYIHRRLRLFLARIAAVEPWRRAHERHHQAGAGPYGVLLSIW